MSSDSGVPVTATKIKKKTSFTPEVIPFSPEQQRAYDAAFQVLNENATFLAPFPSVVSIQAVDQNDKDSNTVPGAAAAGSSNVAVASAAASVPDRSYGGVEIDDMTAVAAFVDAGDMLNNLNPSVVQNLTTPHVGHHELYKALEQLEGLEKEESALLGKTPLTRQLTELITGESYRDSLEAVTRLEALGRAVPRRVCQHPFKKNDIVWVCRTCQADETCVLCHACFSQSNHDGHDVAFYHAQAGGCCDCGDPDAWDPAGFCPHHGPSANRDSDNAALPPHLMSRVRGVVPSAVDWMVKKVAANAETAYARANPPKPKNSALFRKMPSSVGASSASSSGSLDISQTDNNNGTGRRTLTQRSLTMPEEMMDLDQDDDSDDLSVDNFPANNHMHHHQGISRAHVFSPTAASLSRRHGLGDSSEEATAQLLREHEENNEKALQLSITGAAGNGLYIVLHADDIHSTQQLLDALRDFLGTSNFIKDTLLSKLVRSLRQYGQLVVWGTMEIMAEVGSTQVHLWMDGDQIASSHVGALVLERATRLTRHGLFCSILTREELILEQRAVAVLQWLSCVARSCDPLCMTVAECILPNRHLVPLLRADFKMSARVTKAWYSLLLTLLAVPAFKSHLAAAYCDTYRSVTAKYARGMGVLERSGYTLSVQFLNRVTYVIDLVQGRDLLGKLGKSLLETLMVACRNQNLSGRLNPNHFVLTHRRYSPCVSDLKCVLNVKGMPRVIACRGGSFLGDWIAALSVAQFMDSQVWRHWNQGHVEDESRGWVGAFNASISLGSLFERLLGWEDEDVSPIKNPSSPLSRDLMSCVELTYFIITRGIDKWQRTESLFYEATPYTSAIELHKRCASSLPFSTIAAKHGTTLAMRQLPVSQVTPFSFHLPLHRFVAGCLRELCLRKNSDESGIGALLKRMGSQLQDQQRDEIFQGIMEFSVLVLSRAAQVRAGLWRRNGPGLGDQVLNYAEPPFCRNMRDADLLMTQFATIGRVRNLSPNPRPNSDVGMAFLSNILLHRLGIFDFSGMSKGPNSNIDQYNHEVAARLYPGERRPLDAADDETILPWNYSPARESATFILLLEEFLHFIIIFITELPTVGPENREEQTKQAKFRLFREVIHRLASGPKTHSELSEVHHVLSHWDNVLLSEEGKLLNPDDATGAALGTVLADIADRTVTRGKMEPDKWVMRKSAWDYYDPSFFHISLRCHQIAAEGRPKPAQDPKAPFGWAARPFAPSPTVAHPFFQRLRRDATSDVSILAVAYTVLHLHCRQNIERDVTNLRGNIAYLNREKSETALARTIHILTLGAFAWKDANKNNRTWRKEGGGSAGSLFANRNDGLGAPTAGSWVSEFLLAQPSKFLDCDWYEGEECALLLLQRLALHGGVAGGFIAQDSAVRAGAAWLCEFSLSQCPEARNVVTPITTTTQDSGADSKRESEIDRRKKNAKEKAMARMKAQAAKFASMMDVDIGESEEDASSGGMDLMGSPSKALRKSSFGSTHSSTSSAITRETETGSPSKDCMSTEAETEEEIQPRLLQSRPRCIICNYEDTADSRPLDRVDDDDGEGQRKKSKRKAENALGFVGYAQASTVLKGGGGPPPDLDSPMSPVREFVGTHVALCGHAVHSECCESYLATVSHREDRAIGKRDEFRCPLCQRLSNCLVPFIDVGVDWIDSPTCIPIDDSVAPNSKVGDDMDTSTNSMRSVTLHSYLSSTPWWVTRHVEGVSWDGQSAFVERTQVPPSENEGNTPRKQKRRIRSLKKKELYAAWNAMMHTPRFGFVRRRLRRLSSRSSRTEQDVSQSSLTNGEESTGETVVWKRFMDQISDISYRADSKRLGDDHLHDLFGEFRHYIVEKHAYNMANKFTGTEPTDWPSCLFNEPLADSRRQELSREKLLSKLLLSIQAFTYSCCSEGFEARRMYRRARALSSETAKARQDSSIESILNKFGIGGVACDDRLIVMPIPSPAEDSGCWPFDGRLGKLRYLGLAIMAAAGAVAADLIQLTLPFPLLSVGNDLSGMEVDYPDRAPIAYPILFGNVLTHVIAALCATSGRARARNDSLEVVWPVPFSEHGNFASSGSVQGYDSVVDDCEGFLKLGLLARMLQVLLGRLQVPLSGPGNSTSYIDCLKKLSASSNGMPPVERSWMKSCLVLLDTAFSNQEAEMGQQGKQPVSLLPSFEILREACLLACSAATSYLAEAGMILQVLLPGIVMRYDSRGSSSTDVSGNSETPIFNTYLKLQRYFELESVEEMLQSSLVRQVVAEWYDSARRHARASDSNAFAGVSEKTASLQSRLFRTQGFRIFDWPSAGEFDNPEFKGGSVHCRKIDGEKLGGAEQPHDDASTASMQIETIQNTEGQSSTTDLIRREASPTLLTFSSKKSVPLLGGFTPDSLHTKSSTRPRVLVIPTSYTDLYAELGSLMPDCEQTAVCLICGEVLNAGGKGECTRHSNKCGAGAGMFFLLQECSGLIMHKSKAAYIHSPYVDSHGETPQYRGRPLNLDLDRYEHLREVWFTHGVRQKVVAERGSSRQVILPDFY